MQSLTKGVKPRFLIDEKGDRKAIVLSLKQYEGLMNTIEDFKDAIDLLKAEQGARSFTPYEEFRKSWLKD